jgi:predicted dehydrogenase
MLRASAAAVAGIGLRRTALSASDAVRVAVVGVQRRGPQLVDWFRKVPGVRVAALCDCDRQFFAPVLRKLAEQDEKAATVVDFRRLLDDRRLDAVAIAAPNHWHALMAVWACQAGKDVYVEKPVSHTLIEGRRMIQAARRHKRIVQAGTQNRSCTGLQRALAWLREGHLGQVTLVRGFDYPKRESIGKTVGPQPVPDTCDYNLFQGPAPLAPLRRRRLHYDWHWFWATGDGDCGNRGVHTFDHIRWFLGQSGLPRRTISIAGRCGWDDDGETPNTQVTLFDYEPVPVLWEMQTLPKRMRPPHLARTKGLVGSMIIECEGGYLGGYRSGGVAIDRSGTVVQRFKGDGGVTHAANFVEALRQRKPGLLRADVREGHVSAALCHLANISYHVGRPAAPKTLRRAVQDNKLLADATARLLAHLAVNGIEPAKTPLTLGQWLTTDPATERFTGDAAELASRHRGRKYRPPFVLPEEV